jgi:D-sedoheptulose 7-phosphate isomerase
VVVTAIGNDYGYEELFARQVRGHGRPGDVLIVFSTSGRSPNVVNAVVEAGHLGMDVVALTGPTADVALQAAQAWIPVESRETTHIQEIHAAAIHIMCLGVERMLHASAGLGQSVAAGRGKTG